MPDAFTDFAKVIRSHIPTANVAARLEVPNKRHIINAPHDETTRDGGIIEDVTRKIKIGTPLDSIDNRLRKKKGGED